MKYLVVMYLDAEVAAELTDDPDDLPTPQEIVNELLSDVDDEHSVEIKAWCGKPANRLWKNLPDMEDE